MNKRMNWRRVRRRGQAVDLRSVKLEAAADRFLIGKGSGALVVQGKQGLEKEIVRSRIRRWQWEQSSNRRKHE